MASITKRDVEVGVEDVELWFDKYKDKIRVEETEASIDVYFTEYLGTQEFNKLAAISKENNGHYVPANKQDKVKGHFTFSRGKQTEKPQQGSVEYYAKRLDGIFDELARVREEMWKEVQVKKREAS